LGLPRHHNPKHQSVVEKTALAPDTISPMHIRLGVDKLARVLEVAFWVLVILGLVLMFINETGPHYGSAVSIGVASSLFGVRAFLGHGEGRITALGLFNLSTALFAGLGAVYAGSTEDMRVPGVYLALAALAVFIPQVAITFLAWGQRETVSSRFPAIGHSRWLTRWGFLALLMAAVAKYAGLGTSVDPYIEAAAFTAMVLVALGLYWRPDARILSWSSIVVGALALVYAEVFHIGSGRLRIVALACAIGVIITARFQRRELKWLAIAATAPALWWLAQDRKDLQESLQSGASEGRTGLESMLEPIIVFGRLIQSHVESGFPLSFGHNLLSYPFVFMPETWFSNAPQALGYELVQIWAPEKYGTGYSVVATSSGEAYYNFGWFGLVLIIPGLVLVLRLVDRQMVKCMSAKTGALGALLWIALWAMLAGGISDLTWSGQHTFLTRTTARLPLWLVLAALAAMHVKLSAYKAETSMRTARVQATQ
jgi:hypothetical protein